MKIDAEDNIFDLDVAGFDGIGIDGIKWHQTKIGFIVFLCFVYFLRMFLFISFVKEGVE